MALYLPQSEESFAKISGVGQEKLKQYGQLFTEVIGTYAKDKHLIEKAIPGKRSARSRRVTRLGSTYQETKKLVVKKISIETMASRRGVLVSRIVYHIEKLISCGEEINVDYLRPSAESLKKIKEAFQKSGGTALAPVRAILGKQYSYEELRIARLFIKP
jgi:ATP-dependent DNA helicase RecQ